MTPRSNICEDEEGVWIVLDPQNREEWEAFWASLLPIVEDQAVKYDVEQVFEHTKIEVPFGLWKDPRTVTLPLWLFYDILPLMEQKWSGWSGPRQLTILKRAIATAFNEEVPNAPDPT